MAFRKVAVDSLDEINKILATVEEYTAIAYEKWSSEIAQHDHSLATHSFVVDNQVEFSVTTKYYEYAIGNSTKFVPTTYTFQKTGDTKSYISGQQVYALMQRYYKIADLQGVSWSGIELPYDETRNVFMQSAKPLLGYNRKYDHAEHYVYVYDLTSAYSSVMLDKIPDVTPYNSKWMTTVGPNEIGFMMDDTLSLVHEGNYADVVFPLIDSPYKIFIAKYFEAKKVAKTRREKSIAKAYLNYGVGYMQKHNPFVRAYIVNSCNEFIEKRLDENSIMWNTDAIYSLTPRPDLELGNEIGQFKVEYEGLLRHVKHDYQYVDTGEVHHRGVPTKWFNKDFNLLTDPLPKSGNIYAFNKSKFRIEEVNDYEI